MRVILVLLSLLLLLNSCSSNPPNPNSFCGKPVIRKVYRGGLYGHIYEETEVSATCPIAIW